MTRRKKSKNDGNQIGLLSLPVMACILGAILFVSPGKAPPDVNDLKMSLDKGMARATELNDSADRIRKDLDKALTKLVRAKKLQAINRHLKNEAAQLVSDKKRLEKSVTEAQKKAALAEDTKQLELAIAQINRKISEKDKKLRSIKERIIIPGLEKFPRPYASVECKQDGATIFIPGKEPNPVMLPLSDDASAMLKKYISQVKGLVVFARSCSFQTTYPAMLDELNNVLEIDGNQLKTALSLVPVRDNFDISPYVYLGGKS